jgi:DNA-binding NtrC family response regulator
MHGLLQRARQVARTHSPVLLLGERGTGKERLARAIHRWSPRSDQPFVTLHCGAVPPALLEVELFGQVGASARTGRLALANGGTLFLDDVGELPAPLQAKLLRVLQAGEFEPMGSEAPVRVDARVIAATHVDLEASVAAGTFREDLYYPLGVFPLELPPLRERKEDIALLAEALLLELAARTGKTGRRLTPEGLARLQAHDWPGNVRELANVLERALILAPGETLGPEVLDLPGRRRRESRSIEPMTLAEATRQHIRRVLNLTDGRIYGPGGAAALLGLKPSTLQSKMKKLGMTRASPA